MGEPWEMKLLERKLWYLGNQGHVHKLSSENNLIDGEESFCWIFDLSGILGKDCFSSQAVLFVDAKGVQRESSLTHRLMNSQLKWLKKQDKAG